ncbi:C2H2-type domain-containing protein [Mycena indigotica]|uniref:C2H2-type domain-containing protein n=1 Tax=Mycena indigotica TaxID=2126181 RepID=A0A8H6WDQ8_9AGAR|nr:C2H2-type domain-containing protein [Mycena indigotica]KAF7312751.1 C2H2-type domain-containing protein [Mycena indigotica]
MSTRVKPKRQNLYHRHCRSCEMTFATEERTVEHLRVAHTHDACADCFRFFVDKKALEEHYRESSAHNPPDPSDGVIQAARWGCRKCHREFKTEQVLHEHYQHSGRHHYCTSCNRLFDHRDALQTHLRSSDHPPPRIPCPLKRCQSDAFLDEPALISHLSAGCGATLRLDAQQIARYIDNYYKQHDPASTFVFVDPAPGTPAVTDRCWNGSKFECFLCSKQFPSMGRLKTHLFSPAHEDPSAYKCRRLTCRQKFDDLGSFWEHVGSEICGVRRFRTKEGQVLATDSKKLEAAQPQSQPAFADNANNDKLVLPANQQLLRVQSTLPDPKRISFKSQLTPQLAHTAETADAGHLATDNAWNGSKYECYLCHHTFRLGTALNNHLRQHPRHAPDHGYTCPGTTCARPFATLPALWAHVDTEECGVSRFRHRVIITVTKGIAKGRS